MDAAGCVDSLVVEVPEPDAIEIEVALINGVSCFDTEDAGLAIIETNGGSGIYEYYISNNPTVLTTQTEWTGLAGGQTVSIYAIDSNGCIGQSAAVGIITPTEINVGFQSNAGVVEATCADTLDGEIYLQAFGGGAFHHPVLCGWRKLCPSPLIVTAGTYTVTAQDANGCMATMEQEVVVEADFARALIRRRLTSIHLRP